MTVQRRSFLRRMMLGEERPHTEREEKVLNYVVHRINDGAPLHEIVREDYVVRNCSQREIDDILRCPELVRASRSRLERAFLSGELAPSSLRRRL
ncbi:hypothetical protein [Rubrobacter calidifluminis]|uniref:hypothetical protein n=1 Tax=Rubrobacter calidifluminis TaxID=1392640 RepID=UPI00235F3389|nr:hypothetical protein [Rubrobacter calidifluminis]